MKRILKPLASVLLLLCATSMSGCGVTLGPKIQDRVVMVNLYDDKGEEVIAGRVAKNVKVPVQVVTKDGTVVETQMDIGGWNVSHPSPPKEEAKLEE